MNAKAATAPPERWLDAVGPVVWPLVLLLVTRGALWAAQPFASEDAYITFRYASMLARGEGLVYNPGEHVMGFTSLPWTLWCGLGALLRIDLVGWTRATALLTDAITLVLGAHLLRRAFSPAAGLCFAVFFAGWPLFAAGAMSGLEVNVVVAALLLTTALLSARHPAAGVALGVFATLRPECLPAALVLALGARGRDRAIAAAIVMATLAWLTFRYGSPIPQSVLAKAEIYGTPGAWAGRYWWEWLLPFRPGRFSVTTEGQHLELLAVVFSAALAAGAVQMWRARREPIVLAAAAGLGVWLGYVLLGVAFFWWYLVLPLAALALVAAAGFPAIVRGRWLPVTAVLFVCGAWTLGFPLYVGRAQAEAREFASVADYLQQAATPGDEVLLEPIGMIGFRAPVRITDEIGLVSPDVSRRRLRGPGWYADIVRQRTPRWLVIRPDFLSSGEAFAGEGAPFRSDAERAGLFRDYVQAWPAPSDGPAALLVLRRAP